MMQNLLTGKIRLVSEAGIKSPEFVEKGLFKTIIWRKEAAGQVTDHDTE